MILHATAQDIPALVALINSAYRGEGSKQGWTTEADLIKGLRTDFEDLTEIFSDPETTFLKFCDDSSGTIIGCVRLQKKDNRLYLGMLTVSPIVQAKGIGKQMLIKAEEVAKEQNSLAIFMTVLSIRAELIAWYERHGYQKTGEVIPFQPNDKFEVIAQQLEFLVLEKPIA
jgi:ribosomal protein S18 acetylase RimI-like enzyme